MKTIAIKTIALAAALTLAACSKHGDNAATPADGTENAAGSDLATDNAAGGGDLANGSGTANEAGDANVAGPDAGNVGVDNAGVANTGG